MQYVCSYASPLGGITAVSDGQALTGLWFDGQKYFPAALEGEYTAQPLAVFEQTKEWLDVYFAGKAPAFTPPLALNGSPFRMRVWQLLLQIPFGRTATYGEIAGKIQRETGKRVSAQAVGGAVAHNPLSLVIPCHRVVGGNGSLTGYAGGLDKKIALLRLEGADVANFSVPHKTTAL